MWFPRTLYLVLLLVGCVITPSYSSLKLIQFNGLKAVKEWGGRTLLASTLICSPFHTNLSPAHAETNSGATSIKKENIDDRELLRIVGEDITVRQALVTADFTRALYDENCKFQDEIDTYPLDKYVQGTKALFNSQKSHVDLAGPVQLDETKRVVSFPFKERLTFNVPFNPYVDLTGRVELTRDTSSGLFVYSREFWDQPVIDVVKNIRF